MKKIYIKPVCDTYKVVNNSLLEHSPNVDPNQNTDGMDAKGINFFMLGDEEDYE